MCMYWPLGECIAIAALWLLLAAASKEFGFTKSIAGKCILLMIQLDAFIHALERISAVMLSLNAKVARFCIIWLPGSIRDKWLRCADAFESLVVLAFDMADLALDWIFYEIEGFLLESDPNLAEKYRRVRLRIRSL